MRKIGYHKPFFRKNKLLTVYLDPRGNFISVFIPHQYQNKSKKTFILILRGSFFNNFMKFNKFDEKPQSLKFFRRFEHTPKVLNLRGLVFEQYLFKYFNNAYDISLMPFLSHLRKLRAWKESMNLIYCHFSTWQWFYCNYICYNFHKIFSNQILCWFVAFNA